MNDNAMILSKNVQMLFDDDCMNKNTVVIGTPGSGKTYCYVKPNIINLGKAGQSMIISDTKGDLVKKYGEYLKNLGYEVLTIDLIDTSRSLGYNPMLHIENDRDVLTFAHTLVPYNPLENDPYWSNMARFFIEALTAYVCLEKTDREKRIRSLLDLFKLESYQKPQYNSDGKRMTPEPSELCKLFKELEDYSPNSFAVEIYKMYEKVKGSDITDSSILSSVSEKLMPFVT
ncbi:MAG: type IV secretory system conjugative DNA transfer family protein, partial [Ruminococcus sp.]|nr:type IV secretory system conjugative DNA transfer family protein [Ruminococcus sp.]